MNGWSDRRWSGRINIFGNVIESVIAENDVPEDHISTRPTILVFRHRANEQLYRVEVTNNIEVDWSGERIRINKALIPEHDWIENFMI
jgi:hypothetical protein